MKIGVSSYSFSKLVRSGVMSQLDIIAKVKEMGFDVIEFSTLTLPEGETRSHSSLALLLKLRKNVIELVLKSPIIP